MVSEEVLKMRTHRGDSGSLQKNFLYKNVVRASNAIREVV